MNVEADSQRCVGSGQCVMFAPDVFGQNNNGDVFVHTPNPAPEFEEVVNDAADACPASAISVQ